MDKRTLWLAWLCAMLLTPSLAHSQLKTLTTPTSEAFTSGRRPIYDGTRAITGSGAEDYCAPSGGTDTYACNLTPAITGYVTGGRYSFKADVANTGAATINFNALGAKTIKKAAGGVTTDLADNDIRAGQVVIVQYDGTNMQMQSTSGNAASGGTAGGSDKSVQFRDGTGFGGFGTWNSTAGGLKIDFTNPDANSDANDHAGVRYNCTTDGSTTNPNFSNETCLELVGIAQHGQNIDGAKKTIIPLSMNLDAPAAGQRIMRAEVMNCKGMGDCGASSTRVTYAGSDITGDEGQAFALVSYLLQQGTLTQTEIATTPTPTTCNTTTTQTITASKTPQAVTVASTTGCAVDDWVVIGQAVASGAPNIEAVKLTAVGGGTITAVFTTSQSSGVTVTPAKPLTLNTTNGFGQDRWLVNTSGASYATGTVSGISGGGFTGSGTSWTNSIVGGTSTNIGCIALTADDYTGPPFTTGSGTLKSWYPINVVTSSTLLGIHTFSTAGDTAYRGKGPGAGGYIIRPCARVLRVIGNTVILETTAHTWTAADTVELAIAPDPDVTGFNYRVSAFTPGGTYRNFLDIRNTGARTFTGGISITGAMQTGSNADTVAWGSGVTVDDVGTGVIVLKNTGNAFTAGTTSTSGYASVTSYSFSGMNFGGGGGVGLFGDGSSRDVSLRGADNAARLTLTSAGVAAVIGSMTVTGSIAGVSVLTSVSSPFNATNSPFAMGDLGRGMYTSGSGLTALAANGVGILQVNGGDIRVEIPANAPLGWTAVGATTTVTGTFDTSLARSSAAGIIGVTSAFEFTEISTPSAPASNKGILFAKDNGSGKTQLCALFPSGAAQCFATEP